MLILASFTMFYLLSWVVVMGARWRKKQFSLNLFLVGIVVVGGLMVTAMAYMKAYQDWQISIFALGFMVLGGLQQIYEYQHRLPLSLKWHLIQFGFHASLIFILYLASQI